MADDRCVPCKEAGFPDILAHYKGYMDGQGKKHPAMCFDHRQGRVPTWIQEANREAEKAVTRVSQGTPVGVVSWPVVASVTPEAGKTITEPNGGLEPPASEKLGPTPKLCGCGCGIEIASHKLFAWGHRPKRQVTADISATNTPSPANGAVAMPGAIQVKFEHFVTADVAEMIWGRLELQQKVALLRSVQWI